MHKPDFFMTSRELTGEWAKLRTCWLERRVSGPYHSEYAVVRIDPPAISPRQSEAVERILISPKRAGDTLFPRNADPMPVLMYLPKPGNLAFGLDLIRGEDVYVEAWCEIYSKKAAAEKVANQL